MISALVALLGPAFAAPAAPITEAAGLPGVFVAACLDGRLTLPRGIASQLAFDELPAELRKQFKHPASSQVWQLARGQRTYLYVLNFVGGKTADPKICGLASETMTVAAAADALELRMAGYVGAERLPGMQWLMPKDGYVAAVTRQGEFTVAQINWLSERRRIQMMKEVRQVSP